MITFRVDQSAYHTYMLHGKFFSYLCLLIFKLAGFVTLNYIFVFSFYVQNQLSKYLELYFVVIAIYLENIIVLRPVVANTNFSLRNYVMSFGLLIKNKGFRFLVMISNKTSCLRKNWSVLSPSFLLIIFSTVDYSFMESFIYLIDISKLYTNNMFYF